MGFSTSGATAIIFIGLLVAVGIAYPVLQTAHEERLTAINDRDDRTLEMQNTAIELVDTTHDGGDLTVTVNNTGSTTLSVSATDLLLDGDYVTLSESESEVDDASDRDLWQPGETLTITTQTDDPDRIRIVTEHGIAATEVR